MRLISALAAVLFLLSSCGPNPRRELSEFEKQTDLYWLFSTFEQNYAPLEYKQNLHGFDYATLKQQILTEGMNAKTNEDFYLVAHKFVSTFADAHTSARLTPAGLPSRSKVAYLGFKGFREGDALVIEDLLPTYKLSKASTGYPLKKDDRILKIDGETLKDFYTKNLRPYHNIGLEEANYTAFFNKIFNRFNLEGPLPKKDSALLTVKRGTTEFEVELPWITKDFYEYQREQTLAQQSLTKTPGTKKKTEFHMRCFSPSGLFDYNQCPEFKSLIRNHAGFKFGNTFRRFNPRIEWIISEVDESGDVVVNNKKEVTPFEVLKKVRFVPSNAVVIPGAKTYPAYVTSQKTAAGVMMLVGVVNINTFSPAGAEADVLKEFKATLEAFKNLGVKRVVIDTINNGGGSLSLGMNLAQSLNSRAIEFPSVEFRLSESWIDQFERGTIWGTNDTDKELKKRVYNALLADQSSGKWLSRPFNASRLFAQAFTPNEKLKDHGFKYVLLVNEMCASMCDIFAGILQDNKMAKVLGSQTLGAGGNVVMHAAAPNSGIYVSQTESLIKRTNGEYLENNGVKPDLALKVNESTSKRYDKVLKEAFIEVLKL